MERLEKRLAALTENVILLSRFLLVPLLLALLFRIFTIIVDFYRVLIGSIQAETLNEHTLVVLQLLDITMIANLIWLISAGSYYVFIDKNESGKKRPRCLTHISSGILKEKMAGSLIGVSSVHLLQVFLHLTEEAKINWNSIGAMLAIHSIFIVGLLAFCHLNAADHHNHKEEGA